MKRLVVLISIIIFCFSTICLISYFGERKHDNLTYENLKKQTFTPSDPERGSESECFLYNKIMKLNSDCVGWIKVPNTKIDYPLMYLNENNEYYLHRDFYKNSSKAGVPFLDGECSPNENSNLIIYGHHMKDGSMFADLVKYENENFLDKHKKIFVWIYNNKYEYEIFSIMKISADVGKSFYNMITFQDKDEYETYLKLVKKQSIFPIDNIPKSDDNLLLLSTCEYTKKNGRLLVLAKKIRKGE